MWSETCSTPAAIQLRRRKPGVPRQQNCVERVKNRFSIKSLVASTGGIRYLGESTGEGAR